MPVLRESRKLGLVKDRLTNKDTYATVLLAIVIDNYGTEAFEWTPETIRRELEEDFGVTIPPIVIDKIMAGILIMTTNLFFEDVWYFIHICNVLSGTEFDPDEYDPADSYEMAWGITEALQLYSPDADEEPFSDKIRWYMGAVLDYEGIDDPPDVLRLALREKPKVDVHEVLSSNPEAYAAFLDKRTKDRNGIEGMLRERLKELFEQLQTTPFNEKVDIEAIAKITKNL